MFASWWIEFSGYISYVTNIRQFSEYLLSVRSIYGVL